ncbi:hypothetical protein ACK30D_20730 [Aeromonas caviae]
MMKVLAVMTYFQISLPTHNWDSANKKGSSRLSGEGRLDFQKKVF